MVEILTREHAFHRISLKQFEREVVRVRAAIRELDGVAVALEFRKLGALIGDGHTSVMLPHGRPWPFLTGGMATAAEPGNLIFRMSRPLGLRDCCPRSLMRYGAHHRSEATCGARQTLCRFCGDWC
jgi:hypothetical protein